jgi:malate dehydrogenase
VVVITSGIPRKPGMTREELIGINAGIVKMVVDNVLIHSPEAIIVVVSNPMDTMTYLALKYRIAKKQNHRNGGLLIALVLEPIYQWRWVNQQMISAMVIGGHGDTTMIPLTFSVLWNSSVSISFRRGVGKVAADTMVVVQLLRVFRNISLVCAWSVCCLFSR